AQSLGRLTDIVRKAEWQDQTAFPAPKVLIVSPPKMNLTTSPFAARFTGAKAKSDVLASLVKPVVTAKGAYFFDAATVVEYAEQADQIHLTAEQHRKLGEAVAEEVKKILGSN
ncbi:MAG: hypothetical protein Q4E62_10240, partial [Sutterellaceae bacterium]|nr:hypothetical protein [Sutterellaceae bacterium]